MAVVLFIFWTFFLLMGLALVVLLLSHLFLRSKPTADEIYAVTTPDGWKIRLFRHLPRVNGNGGEPVLLCPGVIANHWEFEIPRGGSLVDALTQAGYDCWVLDPRGRRSSSPALGQRRDEVTIDDWLNQDIPAAMDYVRVATRYDQIHYIGHSMGGMLLYAFDAAFGQDKIASGTTLASPPGFEGLEKRSYGALVKALRLHGVLEFFARALTPLARVLKPQSFAFPINWDNLNPKVGSRALFNAFELPSHRVAAELEFWIRNKIWRMNNDELDVAEALSELEVPLLAIYAVSDPLVPVESARSFFEAIPHDDKRMLILARENGHSADYNHIDIAMGKRSWDEVFTPIVDWLKEHPTTDRIGDVRGQERADAITSLDAIRERLESQAVKAQMSHRLDVVEEDEDDEDTETLDESEETPATLIDLDEVDEFTRVEKLIIIEQEVEIEEHVGPVLPGAAMDELARLARQVRDDGETGIASAKPAAAPQKKAPATKGAAPAKKTATPKAAAKAKPKPKSAPKKPAAKRKPKTNE